MPGRKGTPSSIHDEIGAAAFFLAFVNLVLRH
jgi:hypothetical protein